MDASQCKPGEKLVTTTNASDGLVVEQLTIAFGSNAIVQDLDLTVPRGRSAAIQGRSGSGKSTLLAAFMGMIKPKHGTIQLNGAPITGLTRTGAAHFRANHIGVVFQHAELLPELTALENIILPGFLAGRAARPTEQRARELLALVGVPNSATPAGRLSGGERQRVAVARAMVSNPEMILADEPTGSLDAELRDGVASILFDLPQATGCSLVVVTHDPAVARLADHSLELTAGALCPAGLRASNADAGRPTG
jgi:putative ABC transport system ATP-binding protein/lipoprotein-releasing system ATP-binding protein